jgi:hypothetical protein
MYIKQRLFALVMIIGFIGLTYYNWQQLWDDGRYSLKMAAFGPVGVVGGFFLMLFPTMAGRPETTRDRLVLLAVFVAGLAAGLFNWYLMDPGLFGL